MSRLVARQIGNGAALPLYKKRRPGRAAATALIENFTSPHAYSATVNAVKRSNRKLSLYQSRDYRRAGCHTRPAAVGINRSHSVKVFPPFTQAVMAYPAAWPPHD